MDLTAPATAFSPFWRRALTIHVSSGRNDPPRRIEVRGSVLIRDPFRLGAPGTASMLGAPVTYEIALPLADLPAGMTPAVGNWIEAADNGAMVPRLTITGVHANGPLLHLSCEARGGARP